MQVSISVRIDFPQGHRLGPGKARLLEAIDETGSISAAGRALGMSYKRAWSLVDDLNRMFTEPLVTSRHGGAQGGGAELTTFGRSVILAYRSVEAQAGRAADAAMTDITAKLAPS